MNRREIIKKIENEAKRQGLTFEIYELTNHSGIKVGNTASTLKRHRQIDETTARKFFDQFAAEFGKGWWR